MKRRMYSVIAAAATTVFVIAVLAGCYVRSSAAAPEETQTVRGQIKEIDSDSITIALCEENIDTPQQRGSGKADFTPSGKSCTVALSEDSVIGIEAADGTTSAGAVSELAVGAAVEVTMTDSEAREILVLCMTADSPLGNENEERTKSSVASTLPSTEEKDPASTAA